MPEGSNQLANLLRSEFLDGPKGNHHVRYLYACVINIILNLHAVPRMPQYPHHCVAQHRVPHVPDVRRLVWIDAGVLDNHLARPRFAPSAFLSSSALLCALSVSALSFLLLFLFFFLFFFLSSFFVPSFATRHSPLATFFLLRTIPKRPAIKIRIQVPATCHPHFRDPLTLPQTVRNLLRNLPRRPLQPLRQFKTHWRSRLSHLNLRRPLQHNRQLHAIFLANMPPQRLAQPVRQYLVHVSSIELEWSTRIQSV